MKPKPLREKCLVRAFLRLLLRVNTSHTLLRTLHTGSRRTHVLQHTQLRHFPTIHFHASHPTPSLRYMLARLRPHGLCAYVTSVIGVDGDDGDGGDVNGAVGEE